MEMVQILKWKEERNIKIEKAVKTLKAKQDIQMDVLRKKNKTALEEAMKIRKKQDE